MIRSLAPHFVTSQEDSNSPLVTGQILLPLHTSFVAAAYICLRTEVLDLTPVPVAP